MATVTPINSKANTDVLERIARELHRANVLAYAATLPPSLQAVRDNLIDSVGRELITEQS